MSETGRRNVQLGKVVMRTHNSKNSVRYMTQYGVLILVATTVLLLYYKFDFLGNHHLGNDLARISVVTVPNEVTIRETVTQEEAIPVSTPRQIQTHEQTIHVTYPTTISSVDKAKEENIVLPSRTSLNTTVLILAYLRGGSSFTADLLQISPKLFYLFEPVRAFSRGHFTNTKFCEGIGNTCRLPRTWRENPAFVLKHVVNLFTCNFQHIPLEMIHLFRSKYVMSKEQTKFKNCTNNDTLPNCLIQFEKECKRKVKLIKTIRLTMEAVEELLRKVPDLKVIHLLRDPRGSIASRIHGGFIPKTQLEAAAAGLCSQMYNDISLSIKLMDLYPDQIKTVMYEAVAEHPMKALKSLHEFTGTHVSEDMINYVHEHTSAGKTGNGYYRTVRTNSSQTAHNWRRELSWKSVKMIDDKCQQFYDIVGYLPFTQQEQLHDLSYKTRNPVNTMLGPFI